MSNEKKDGTTTCLQYHSDEEGILIEYPFPGATDGDDHLLALQSDAGAEEDDRNHF
jgi:hypothetical protein